MHRGWKWKLSGRKRFLEQLTEYSLTAQTEPLKPQPCSGGRSASKVEDLSRILASQQALTSNDCNFYRYLNSLCRHGLDTDYLSDEVCSGTCDIKMSRVSGWQQGMNIKNYDKVYLKVVWEIPPTSEYYGKMIGSFQKHLLYTKYALGVVQGTDLLRSYFIFFKWPLQKHIYTEWVTDI